MDGKMKFAMTLLLGIFQLHLVSGLNVPLPTQSTQNGSSSANAHPLSTTFDDSSPPPGLRVVISWDPALHTFDPSELWLGIVAAGSTLALSPSGQRMTHTETFRLVISHAQFRLMPVSNEYCTIDAMVWGLWEIGNQMARRYPMPNRIPLFSAQIWTSRGWLGTVGLSKPEPEINEHEGIGAAATERRGPRSASLSSPSTPSLIKRVDSGSIRCREDHDLVVEFQFLYRDLDPGQVFTAFLRSNTIFATNGMQDTDVTLVAYGSGGRISLGLTDVKEGPGGELLTWNLARIGTRTLWREVVLSYKAQEGRFVDRPRFEKLGFDLIYKGERIGLGLLG